MKTILVTGANRGLGLEIVQQFYQDGWKVIACCRRPDQATKLRKIAENSIGNIRIFPLDVQNVASMQSLQKSLTKNSVDVLINNAGILGKQGRETFGKLYEFPENAIDVLQVNTLAPLFLSELLKENVIHSQMKTIVNISSDLGSITLNDNGDYCVYRMSKCALNSITKTMAEILKKDNVKVISIHPGWVKTDMGGPAALITPEESVAGIKKVIVGLTLNDSGSFFRYNGERVPW